MSHSFMATSNELVLPALLGCYLARVLGLLGDDALYDADSSDLDTRSADDIDEAYAAQDARRAAAFGDSAHTIEVQVTPMEEAPDMVRLSVESGDDEPTINPDVLGAALALSCARFSHQQVIGLSWITVRRTGYGGGRIEGCAQGFRILGLNEPSGGEWTPAT